MAAPVLPDCPVLAGPAGEQLPGPVASDTCVWALGRGGLGNCTELWPVTVALILFSQVSWASGHLLVATLMVTNGRFE